MVGKRGSEIEEYAKLKREKEALFKREKILRDRVAAHYGKAVMDAGAEDLEARKLATIVAAVVALGFEESASRLGIKGYAGKQPGKVDSESGSGSGQLAV